MNRGTVMERSSGNAVVLTPDGQFLRISIRRDVAIGDEVTWTDSQTMPYKRRSPLSRSRWMSSAAAAAAVLLLMFGLWSFRTPTVVAYVSMDINPSVEFGLDSQERVRELRAVNDDALPYIEGVVYKGKPIETVMEILARKLTESHILNAADGEVVIASVRLKSVDAKWEQQVTAKIERVLIQVSAGTGDTTGAKASLDIEKLYLPVEVREEAQANGISSGKMAFWLAAEKKGHAVPLASLQQQSLKKIASSWGGVKEVLDDRQDHQDDQETWKKLLADQKHKKKQKNEGQLSPSPSASPANEEPLASDSVEPSDDQHESGDQKKPVHEKKKQEDKKKQIEDKLNKRDEKKKIREDDQQRSKNNQQREKQQESDKSKPPQDDRQNRHDDHRGDNGDD